MSNSISRRTFLKCTGASVAALGAASLLGGCQQNGSATIVDNTSFLYSSFNFSMFAYEAASASFIVSSNVTVLISPQIACAALFAKTIDSNNELLARRFFPWTPLHDISPTA